jgi:phasin
MGFVKRLRLVLRIARVDRPWKRETTNTLIVKPPVKHARTGVGRQVRQHREAAQDRRIKPMDEATETKTKSKPLMMPASAFEFHKFEMPKFEMPNFEMPKMEIPAAFREFAEKSVSQAKETYEKMKSAAEEATDVLEGTYTTASQGARDYGLKMIEQARTNTNAAFDFANEFMAVKSVSEAVELTTAHARKQFETFTSQTKELTALAQKVTTETTEPVKESFSKAFKKIG